MTARLQQGYLPSLQGLRGLAAFTVIVVHSYLMPDLVGILPADLPGWARTALNTGGRGVELFFIISGFLIPASLVRHGKVSKFFYDRVMRIMPLFVLLHLALFVAGPIVGYKFFAGIDVIGYIRAFLANLFFVQDLVGEPVGQQNAWTLGYEWLFYFWFAAFYTAAVTRSSRVVAGLLLALAVVCAIAFPRCTYFAVGMLMARFSPRMPVGGVAGAVLGLGCVAFVYYVCDTITPYLGLPAAVVLFALVLTPESGFARLLSTRPFQFVGKVSYSLYLVHPFVLFPLLAVARHLHGRGIDEWVVWLGFVVVGIGASIVAATISFELVEVRLRRALDALFTGHARPRKAALQEQATKHG